MAIDGLLILHLSCVLLSFSSFVLRGVWMLQRSAWLEARATKTLPHALDTLLLLSGLALVLRLPGAPWQHPWLLAKVLLLLALYIPLGMLALRPGRPQWLRALAWAAALGCFMLMATLALTKAALERSW